MAGIDYPSTNYRFPNTSSPAEILLVDDDEIFRWAAEREFENLGLKSKVHFACNGEEALQMLKGTEGYTQIKPKVMLIDIRMPRMDGHELLENIRKDENLQCIVAVMFSSSSRKRDVELAYKFNVAGYLSKPVNFGEAFEAIEKLNIPYIKFKWAG